MGLLQGVDISHHNGDNAVQRIIEAEKDIVRRSLGIDFFMVKATEGKTYTDPKVLKNCNDVIKNGLLLGMYHFARPENNTPEEEVSNFLKTFNNFIGFAIPVIDWEGTALKYDSKWALEWCDSVFKITGVRPLVYVQHSALKQMKLLADNNYGLWVARYNKSQTLGSLSPWTTWAMWQYTSTPYDKNYFNGTKEQFLKYCMPITNTEEPECDCDCHHCGCCVKEDEE